MTHDIHEANRMAWNAATVAHNSHKRDQAKFLRDDGTTLFPEEIELLGDITGKSLVHLQCNAGQDTLCLARLGASIIGVDISDEAITFAQQLSLDSRIPGTFVRSDVYDWLEEACKNSSRHDIVFCSYGAICWLSDLARWANAIADILVPGGRFVAIDFHPTSMMFDEQVKLAYPYFGDNNPMKWDEGVGDYVGVAGGALSPSGHETGVENFENPHPVYEYQWPIATILTVLLNAGLRITRFTEYPYSNGAKWFDEGHEGPGRRIYPPEGLPSMPMMFGVVAKKT